VDHRFATNYVNVLAQQRSSVGFQGHEVDHGRRGRGVEEMIAPAKARFSQIQLQQKIQFAVLQNVY
jgi:hypothetical protein